MMITSTKTLDQIKASMDRGTYYQAGKFFIEKSHIPGNDIIVREKARGRTVIVGRYLSMDKAILSAYHLFLIWAQR